MTATPPADGPHRFISSTLALLRAGGGALRDLWLMLGVTLALFLVLEGLYRAQAAIRGTGRALAQPVVDSTLH
ncbi:MAG: hypothetical protein E4H38_00385, partial [Gemmatimonadales bacterium]